MSGSAQRTRSSAAPDATGDDVEVRIRGLMMEPVPNMPMIVLKDGAADLGGHFRGECDCT